MTMAVELCGIVQDGGRRAGDVPDNPRITLRLVRGAVAEVRVRVLGVSGASVDLTGSTVTLTVRGTGCDGAFLRKTAAAGGLDGLAVFSLSSGDTTKLVPGRYVYDVWVDDSPVIPTSPLLLEPSVFPAQ